MLFRKRLAMLVAISFLGLTAFSVSQTNSQQPSANLDSTVFSQPRIQQAIFLLRQQTTAAFANDNYTLAESLTQQCLELLPNDSASHYNLACAEARLGKNEAAVESLRRSIANGFRDPTHIANDDDLSSLKTGDNWQQLLELAAVPFARPQPETVTTAAIIDGVALVATTNTVWNPAVNRFQVVVEKPSDAALKLSIAVGEDPIALLLNKWQAAGTAGGLANVLYDNHDRDHSNMNWKRFPQLSRIEYSEEARRENLDNGLQYQFQFSRTTFGNSSTAMVGNPFWRSQPRLAYANGAATAQLAFQYFRNHLYVYPEHKDYDPGHNGNGGFGDVFPVNTPFVLISQGSSYSDAPFLEAIAATLAAFHPNVMSKLESNGMVSPCLQMILRRCLKHVKTDSDYLAGMAHPVVFDGQSLDVLRMIKMAHKITPSDIPPIAIMEVVEESESIVGKDYFEFVARENLFTSAVAIARAFRTTAQTSTMTVSAIKSVDLNRRKLTWNWVVLQGDPEKIEIQPLNTQGSAATITIKHHQRRPIQPGSKIQSSRVDIGVFANNGTYYSPPAIISFYCPENERRDYDDRGRIRSIQYTDFAHGGDYADPMIATAKDWRDEYLNTETGTPNGWVRHRGDQQQTFTADGTVVTASDELGRPTATKTVRYVALPRPGKTPILQQLPGIETIEHAYDSPSDMVGTMQKRLTEQVPAQ